MISIFNRKKAIENNPPTAAVLNKRVKRSVLRARKWYDCLEDMQKQVLRLP